MAEQLAYARRASGLVRGLSLLDAFGVAFMNQGLVVSIGVTLSLGLGVFLGANLVIAAIISFVLAGIGFTLVWGILGATMPRSGGPYVYNSRVLHPVIGVAQSFGDALIWLWWIGTLAPLAIDPGVIQLHQFMGWQRGTGWLQTSTGLFVGATVINVAGFLLVVFGLRLFATAQRAVMALTIAGALAMCIAFSVTSHADFVHHWNVFAAQTGSLDYRSFLDAARAAAGGIPTTWNWHDTIGVMLAMSWLFAYGYSVAFVGGEVRRPRRTMPWANFLAILVPFVFMLWIALVLYRSVGFQFLSATSWYDHAVDGGTKLPGYTFPWRTNIYGLVAIIDHHLVVRFLVALAYIVVNLWWVALSYLAFPRTLFAWGMDRIAPRWFASVNARYASPVKNHVLCFALGEVLIFTYAFFSSNKMQNITLTGFEITSVFAITAVAAILLPYSRRSKDLWRQSPYRRWRLAGVPLVVWGGAVNLVYLGILMYALTLMKASVAFQWFSFSMFAVAWVLGVLWYLFWRRHRVARGVDVHTTYRDLPPE